LREEKKIKSQEKAEMKQQQKDRKNKPKSKFSLFIEKKNTKRNRIIAVIIIVIVLILVANSLIKSRQEKMAVFDVTPSYDVATIGDISYSITGDGNLSTGSSISFSAKTDLSIDNVLVQEGQSVKKGDIIATLNEENMSDNLAGVEFELNDMQATVDASYRVEDTFYIKAPVAGRFKDVQVEEEDLVEEAMADPGYLGLISTVDEMKIAVTEEEYSELEKKSKLVIRTEGYKYEEDIELRRIDEKPYVILPNALRTIGIEAKIYSAASTKEGNELATGILELISFEKVMATYGVISYQDDFENYTIDKGEVLFHVDQFKYTLANSYAQLAKLREEYEISRQLNETLTLVAETDGIITDLSIMDDSFVSKDSTIAVVMSEDDWIASVAVDELDINKVLPGQKATVTIDALDFSEFTAEVQSISSAGMVSGGITTYDVVLAVEDDENFKLAMSLTAEIAVESAENTVLIPSSAVRSFGSKSYVMVAADRTVTEQSEIRKAITNDDMKVLAKYISELGGGMQKDSESRDEEEKDGLKKIEVPEGKDSKEYAEWIEKKENAGFGAGMISNPVELLYADVRMVETGIEDVSYVEILGGLSEGERVLLPIASKDEIDEKSDGGSKGMGMGGFRGK